MSQPDEEAAPKKAASHKAAPPEPEERDLLGRLLFWIFGPPTTKDAISVHSPQARAYRERQRAARQREREERRVREEQRKNGGAG